MGSEDSEAAAWGCPQASFSPSPPWPSPCLCSRAETLWMKNLSLETQVCLFHLFATDLHIFYHILQFFYHKHHKLQISVSNCLVGPGRRFTGTGIWANRFLRYPPVPFVSDDTWRFSNFHLQGLMGKIEKLSPVGFWHTQGWWRFLTKGITYHCVSIGRAAPAPVHPAAQFHVYLLCRSHNKNPPPCCMGYTLCNWKSKLFCPFKAGSPSIQMLQTFGFPGTKII